MTGGNIAHLSDVAYKMDFRFRSTAAQESATLCSGTIPMARSTVSHSYSTVYFSGRGRQSCRRRLLPAIGEVGGSDVLSSVTLSLEHYHWHEVSLCVVSSCISTTKTSLPACLKSRAASRPTAPAPQCNLVTYRHFEFSSASGAQWTWGLSMPGRLNWGLAPTAIMMAS